jgi:hypothetical protein
MLRSIIPRAEKVLAIIIDDLSWIAKSLAILAAFIAPLHTVVGIMMIFLLFDTGSAIYLRFKVEKKRRMRCQKAVPTPVYRFRCMRLFWTIIDPEKLGHTIEKLCTYPIIAFGCFIFDRLVLGLEPADASSIGRFSITNLVFILICFMDFKSFLRNMGRATGNPVFKAVEGLLDNKVKNHTYMDLTNNEKS